MPTLKRFEYCGKEGAQAASLAVKQIQKSKDEIERRFALAALASLEKDAAPYAEGFVTALQDEDAGCRYQAALGLSVLGPKVAEHAEALGKVIKDPDPGVRQYIITALGMAGPAAEAEADKLLEALQDTDTDREGKVKDIHVCVVAAKALMLVKPDAAEAAATSLAGAHWGKSGLHHRNELIRGTCAQALGELGDAALPHKERLRELLADEFGSVRAACAATLAGLGSTVVRYAAEPLAKMVKEDKNREACEAAAAALEHMDPVESLGNDDSAMKRWAAMGVASQATKAVDRAKAAEEKVQAPGWVKAADHTGAFERVEEKAQELAALLGDGKEGHPDDRPDDTTRLSAAVALAAIAEDCQDADEFADNLIGALSDPNPRVRVEAMRPIVKVMQNRLPEAMQILAEGLLEDKDTPLARACSAEALGLAGEAAQAHTKELEKALYDPEFDVRLAAVKALHSAGRQAVRDCGKRLAELAVDMDDPEMRRTAKFALRDYRLSVRFGIPREDAM